MSCSVSEKQWSGSEAFLAVNSIVMLEREGSKEPMKEVKVCDRVSARQIQRGVGVGFGQRTRRSRKMSKSLMEAELQ